MREGTSARLYEGGEPLGKEEGEQRARDRLNCFFDANSRTPEGLRGATEF